MTADRPVYPVYHHPPPAVRRLASAARAAIRWIHHGAPTLDDAELKSRQWTCETCQHYTGTQCALCGCYTGIKLRMRSERCPIDAWPPVDPLATRTLWRHHDLPPHGQTLNASCTWWRGQLWLAWRTRHSHAQIALAPVDPDTGILLRQPHVMPHSFGAPINDDPRLLAVDDDTLLVACHAACYEDRRLHDVRIGYWLLDAELRVRATHVPTPPRHTRDWGAAWEKNWAWLTRDGDIYAVYQIAPRHVVVRVRGDETDVVADHEWHVNWPYGHPSGGAVVALPDGDYLHVGHSHYGSPARYVALAYTFGPDWTPRRKPWGILLRPQTDAPAGASIRTANVVFPGGAWLTTDGRLRIVNGYNDGWIACEELNLHDLIATRTRPAPAVSAVGQSSV